MEERYLFYHVNSDELNQDYDQQKSCQYLINGFILKVCVRCLQERKKETYYTDRAIQQWKADTGAKLWLFTVNVQEYPIPNPLD